MTAIKKYRVAGFVASLAIKAPCKALSDVNLTLSAPQTVNGVPVVVGDRVLVKDQTDPIDNGIYTVETSAWQRAGDWDGARDATNGTLVVSAQVLGEIWQMTTNADTFVVGVDAAAFSRLPANDSESGTFTINWIGWSGSVTSVATYHKVGNMVILRPGISVITGTSDGVSKTSTANDLPATIMPAVTQIVGMAKVSDNGGNFQYGTVEISSAGIISVKLDAVNTLWTNSGTASYNPINLMYFL